MLWRSRLVVYIYIEPMIDPEITRHLHAMFDAHAAAFAALRRANTSMGEANAAMGVAIDAHDEAIQRALDANQAAIDLLHVYTRDHGPAA